ncbi:hypothetical protein PPACK8108_LOCUS6665 [Phakopsora pachyrhizi]|uniref:Secreted protein n=1 Tax=Phakopsora pachyrhizi TaxID=170000 RepID=A0AAV0ARF1_PHAPC|nr:hypothetical protein PPACK8108_LOCUS6665 [Phakopsora pachyrhizi]
MFHRATVFITLFSALSILNDNRVSALMASVPDTQTCSFYTGAYTNSATCNEQPNVVCTQGCYGPYVVATGCVLENGSTGGASSSSQVCTMGFGRNTAAAKACINELGTFRCTGQTSGSATCYGCRNSAQNSK